MRSLGIELRDAETAMSKTNPPGSGLSLKGPNGMTANLRFPANICHLLRISLCDILVIREGFNISREGWGNLQRLVSAKKICVSGSVCPLRSIPSSAPCTFTKTWTPEPGIVSANQTTQRPIREPVRENGVFLSFSLESKENRQHLCHSKNFQGFVNSPCFFSRDNMRIHKTPCFREASRESVFVWLVCRNDS